MSELARTPALTLALTTPSPGANAATGISECLDYGLLDVRGDVADTSFSSCVEKITGLALPVIPNTCHRQDQRSLFWLGPDQWLLCLPAHDLPEVCSGLQAIAKNIPMALTDVSGGYCLLSLRGNGSDEIVRSATSFDVAKLTAGVCTQTLFAKAHVLMWKPHETEYRILVRRSFANYLCRWLIAAGAVLPEKTND